MKYRANASEPFMELYIKALDSMPIGSIIGFAGTDIPNGWLICDGRELSEEEYPELYDALGGSGSTFTLPDYQGRTPVGYDSNDTDFNAIGKTGGNKAMQKHSHTTMYSSQTINVQSGSSATCPKNYPTQNTGVFGTGAEENATNGNLQPYIVQYFIIKAKNTTPTMASIVNATNNSTEDGYSCKFINDLCDSMTSTIYNNNETFNFNGNVYASKNITLPKNISDYKTLLINVGENYSGTYYYDNIMVPSELLVGGNIFRKRIFMAGIQSYMKIEYVSANKINIWLEHTSAISGTKTINVNIQSINGC